MTPAPPPPTDENVDVNDLLNEPVAESDGLDPDSVDADFEQELEDLFSDDLEEEGLPADENEGPVALDDVVEESGQDADDDDLIVLDELAEDDQADDPILLDDVIAEQDAATSPDEAPLKTVGEDADDLEALVEDIAEVNDVKAEPEVEDDDAIELDDLVEETAGEDDDIMDLEAMLEEEGTEESLDLEEEISMEPEDLMDVALAEEAAPDVPVEEAVAVEEIESIMDEPEPAAVPEIESERIPEPEIELAPEPAPEIELEPEIEIEPEIEPEPASEPQVVAGNVFENAQKSTAPVEEVDAELTGLDALEEDEIEDVDSLLDNVEVDVSDVVDAEADLEAEDMDLDLDMGGDLDDALLAESMPLDAGIDVSDDVDVDQLLVEARSEADDATMAELHDKVEHLEARVEELERRLRDEIAQMVPAEAARIIREEIAALAAEIDD
ncbi:MULTISPECIES: hypothetical protein [unclassified Pseudodesulfovibrio]|uniref:hypothetical protein n=1 Tax=unclassified Pseudodesulfovibrio TaxID=2661612 RepID=UPI000FEBD01B|nr:MULTISPECIES: hypothetical protein [unclassified Pseudodesulfovibrio]MCJ2166160.1 hypothetical protein [Pseudodesulfovibrio sp. S3-i]RWU02392.1 hypothetical protein DWB63_16515 [Pseudodesulfovibrio sp. S3]